MKLLKTLWAILPLVLALVVYFGYTAILPTFLKVLLFVVFAIVWFCRKQISDTVISHLKHIPALDHFMWDDAGQKRDENGKVTEERKPIESNIRLVRIGISAAILLVMLGIPLLICGICALIGGAFGALTNAFGIIIQDLSFGNGVGFFIFALFEILITLGALAAVVLAIVKCRNGSWDNKKAIIVGVVAFLAQRIMSWFYFEAGIGGAIGEIITWALIAAILWAIVHFNIIGKICAWRRSRPIDVDSDEDDYFDEDDDDDFVDPIELLGVKGA